MPSFLEFRATQDLWGRFPGRERLDEGADSVALTFDDGPDPDSTPAVLDALDAAGLKATFFMVGEQVMTHRALAREVADRGHSIELHGYEHVPHEELPGRRANDDLARGIGTLQVGTGVAPTRYRPPYGRFSEASYAACSDLGLEPVYWSAWGMDWEEIGADRIADVVARDLSPGVIVLLHDSARYAYRSTALATAQAVPLIAGCAAELELVLEPLS